MSKLQISIHGRTTYRPGEQMTGRIDWSLDAPRDWLELRLLWHTEGKGTRDGSIVQTMRIEQPSQEGTRAFAFVLPLGPYTYRGEHVSIEWGLELVCEGEPDADRVDLKLALNEEQTKGSKHRPGRKRRLWTPAALRRPVSWRKQWPISTALFTAYMALPLMILGSLIYRDVVIKDARAQAAAAWPSIECRLISAERREAGWRRKNRHWVLEVRYEYEVDGQRYIGDVFGFRNVRSHEVTPVLEQLRRYPPRYCYVNPHDPADAVLERIPERVEWNEWLGIGGMTLCLAPIIAAGVLVCIKQLRWRYASDLDDPALPLPEIASSGPAELTQFIGPTGTRILAAISMVCAASAGGGVVWFGESWIAGEGAFALFAALGLAVLFLLFCSLSGYLLLTLLNPRVTLTATSNSVRLGDELDLAWDVKGAVRRLRRLSIAFEGREEAVREKTKENDLFEHTIATISVVDTADRGEMLAGARSITVPADAMHSLKATYNRIVWWIRVRGEMEGRPDINLLFPIVVLPVGMDADAVQ